MKIPIAGPYYTPKQRDKINKELDKVFNKMPILYKRTPIRKQTEQDKVYKEGRA